MVKVAVPRLTPFELLAIAKARGIRIGSTPFGEPPGHIKFYIGASVPWKGYKKKADQSLDDYLKKFKEDFKDTGNAANVADGLKKAIEISQAAKGTYGVAVVEFPITGRLAVMPRKAARQMVNQKKSVKVTPITTPDVSAKELRAKYGEKAQYKAYHATRGLAPAAAATAAAAAPM